jgi:nicotinate-nucleotide adenylyltransferase
MKKNVFRIGIFGGTFDPPHNGHYEIAVRARDQLGLSAVVFVPARIPPHKQNVVTASAKDRLNMLKLLIGDVASFSISTIELKRRGISYTVDTLAAFRKKYPTAELTLIIGADNLAQLHSWKSPKRIFRIASIAVYARKGYSRHKKMRGLKTMCLKGSLLAVSSTGIRKKIAKGLSIDRFVSLPIREYIRQHGLYRPGSGKK